MERLPLTAMKVNLLTSDLRSSWWKRPGPKCSILPFASMEVSGNINGSIIDRMKFGGVLWHVFRSRWKLAIPVEVGGSNSKLMTLPPNMVGEPAT